MAPVTGYRHASIVMLGSFNPAIFQPAWLQEHDFLPEHEFQTVDHPKPGTNKLVVSHDITVLELVSVRFEVTRERWSLATERLDWIPDLGALASSVFKRLAETPLKKVGFNHVRHERIDGDASRSLSHWLSMDALGQAVGEEAALGGTVRAKWKDYAVLAELQKSVHLPNALFVGQNYEAAVGAKNLQERLLQWSVVLERADAVAQALMYPHAV